MRTLQYSLDYDPDYLLLANYIPIHTLLLPRELFRKVGGFDEGLEYSEDWDFLIRLSAETPFRHLRAVTCEYQRLRGGGERSHARGGGSGRLSGRAAQDLRALRRPAHRRRASRACSTACARRCPTGTTATGSRRESSCSCARATAGRARPSHARRALRKSETSRLQAENELLHERTAEYDRLLQESQLEIERAQARGRAGSHGILQEIYGSRTWNLHLFLERLRGRR